MTRTGKPDESFDLRLAQRLLEEEEEQKAHAQERMSVAQLEAMFAEFNSKYFEGTVPPVSVRWTVRAEGHLKSGSTGCYEPHLKTIFLSVTLAGESVPQSMIHEMCHIGTDGSHDERFKRKLRDLEARGAPVDPLDVHNEF